MPRPCGHDGGRIPVVTCLVVAAVVVFVAAGTLASASIERGATATRVAERELPEVRNVAVAFDTGPVDQFVVDGATRAAADVGGFAAPSRNASIGVVRITRNGSVIHAPPAGWLIPFGALSFPPHAVAGVTSPEAASVVDADTVVMNELTASTTGAQVGDIVEVRTASGSVVPLEVGAIRPYAEVGFAELVFTTDVADRLGIVDDTRVVMWGFTDRFGLDRALQAEGVLGRANTKVNRSWDPPVPDDSISTPRIKALVGEPWYRIEGEQLVMHPTWIANSLTPGRVVLNDAVPVRARCHVAIVDDLRAALADVAAAGLGGHIDLGNTNTYGGCYNPRHSRTSGYLSRHAYAVAIDMNTLTNCLGCVPQMHCDIVRIFRRHGFVWGGNNWVADGMHFEWVGERRDQIPYPSKYCPNVVGGAASSADGFVTAGEADASDGRGVPQASSGPSAVGAALGPAVLTAGDPMAHHHHDRAHVHEHDHARVREHAQGHGDVG